MNGKKLLKKSLSVKINEWRKFGKLDGPKFLYIKKDEQTCLTNGLVSQYQNEKMMYMKKKDSWMKYKSLVFLYTSCCSLVLCVPYWTFVAKLPLCIPGSWGPSMTSGPLNPRRVEGSIWCSLNSVSSTLLNYYRNNNSEIFLGKQQMKNK